MLSSLLDPATAPLQYTQICFFSVPFVLMSLSLPKIFLWPSQFSSFWEQLQEAQVCPFPPSVQIHDASADLKAEIRALHWPWSNFLTVLLLFLGLHHKLQINQMFCFIFSSTSSAKLSAHIWFFSALVSNPWFPVFFKALFPYLHWKILLFQNQQRKYAMMQLIFAHVSVICVF